MPACPPPALEDYEEEGDSEELKDLVPKRSKKIRFDDEKEAEEETATTSEAAMKRGEDLIEDTVAPGEETGPQVDEIQRKMLMMAGQDVDQYMKEVRDQRCVKQGSKRNNSIFRWKRCTKRHKLRRQPS